MHFSVYYVPDIILGVQQHGDEPRLVAAVVRDGDAFLGPDQARHLLQHRVYLAIHIVPQDGTWPRLMC